ncbi:hypothetical protein [Trueperella sp. LYQ141]|uniref:hypothetical protein n=1 Tax=Trueperella sp. LYQ141 TaxID=3391058 RepID=UPI003983346E
MPLHHTSSPSGAPSAHRFRAEKLSREGQHGGIVKNPKISHETTKSHLMFTSGLSAEAKKHSRKGQRRLVQAGMASVVAAVLLSACSSPSDPRDSENWKKHSSDTSISERLEEEAQKHGIDTDQVKQDAQKAKEKLGEYGQKAKEKLGEYGQKAKDKASEIYDRYTTSDNEK